MSSCVRAAAVTAVATAVLASVAAAAPADAERVRLTKADMTSARTIMLRLDDLGGAGHGWVGGPTMPNPPSSLHCSGFSPKQSDLVLTGRAASHYALSTVEFENQVEILKTARMVALDWHRTVASPRLVPCLRRLFARSVPKGETFVSFERIPFRVAGASAAAYRALVDLGSKSRRIIVDFALVGVHRTEITLITTAPYAAANDVTAAERRLARTLAARATPGAA